MGSLDPFCKNSLFGILIFLFISNTFAGDTCHKGCTSADTGKFAYKPGNVYEYSFDSLVTIAIHGANNDDTALKVNGQAKVYAEGNCGYVLQLDKVIVTAAKDNQRKQLNDIKKPVRFTLSNGILEPQICAEDDDSDTSLNIKRAIISLLQSSDKNYETDVFGICPTTASQSTVGNVDVITKVRNLDNCGHREGLVHGLITGIVNNDAGIKSSSWFDSDYSAEQKISNGIITHVTVHEEYNFIPAAEGNNGVKTKIKTNLNLDNTASGSPPPVNGKPQSIIFKHPHFVGTKNFDALKKVFDATVSHVDGYTKSDAAKYFTELIRLMRLSDSSTLDELSAISNQRPIGKKVFLDALFRTGTSDSVKTIANQIPRLNDKEKRLAFLSFNLVQSVNKQALSSVAELIKDPNVPNEAYLAVGNLVEKYCDEHSCDDDFILKILKEYVTALKRCDANNRHDEDKIVYVLKGLRNTNHIVKQAANAIANCAAGDHSARIRVAALQAFPAGGCNQNLQDKALGILRNQNEDSEVRIEAYLAAVSCPNAQLANHISDIVNKEEVYQVGGFITSHLKGIRDSTDTTRASARYFLGNVRITKKFPIDPRRYSFNSELSYSVPSLGAGASADYNLIYSQNGFLPRSGRLNVTTELFGKQFNIFEIGARQENFETVLENYFGPKGYFNDNNYQGLYDKTFRQKRSISDQTDKFFKSYKPYGGKQTNNVNLDISTKLFGSEMLFLSLGDNIPTEVEQFGRLFADILQQVKDNAKGYEHTFSGSSMIVDTEIVYPTSIGFPLELTSQATATSTVDVGISVEIENVASNPSNSKGRIKFIPSVSVHANAQIRIVTGVINTGVRTVTDLHSATGANVQITVFNNGNSFNVDIDLPRKKIDLIELKHDSDIFIAESDKPIKSYPLKSKQKTGGSGRFDQLSMFGFTINYAAHIPDGIESATALCFIGPVHLALSVESESKITLHGKHEKTSTQEYWQLTYDTPGSQQPHKSIFTVEVGHIPNDKIYARAQFENPHKRYGVEIGGVDNGNELAFYGKYEGDGDVTTAKIGFTVHGQEYRPILQTSSRNDNKVVNDIAGYRATGSVIVHDGPNDEKQYEFKDLSVVGSTGKEVSISGTGKRSKTGLSVNLNVKSGEDKFNINGLLSVQAGDYQFNAYVEDLATQNKYGGGVKVNHVPGKIAVDVNVKSFDISVDVHHLYEFNEGDDEAHSVAHYLKFENSLYIGAKNKLMLFVSLNGLIDKDHIKYEFEAKHLDKRVGLLIDLIENDKGPGNYKAEAKANFNKHFVDAKYNYEIQGSGKANVDHSLTASTGLKFTIRGHVSPKPTSQDIDIDLNGDWMASHKDKPCTWLLKVTASPEKHSSEFKLNRDNADLLIYSGEINRPSDKPINGKINLNIKDTFVAKGDFKVAKSGRGDLSFLLNFKKVQKKIKLDSKFLISSPKYDIEATLNLDPDKDKTKKIYFKTESVIDKQMFNTNNVLEILSDKYTFESNGAYSGDFNKNGDADGKFILTLPNGRNINGDLRRHITTQNDKTSGTGVVTLTDTLSNGQKRSLKLTGTLSDYNSEQNTFNFGHKLDITDINGQQTHLQTLVKHLPKGHFNSAELSINFNGALAPQPIELNIVLDEYCEEHAVYRISAKDGTSDVQLNGNYHVGGDSKPYDYEMQLNVNAPKTNAKTFSIQSNGKFLLPTEPNGLSTGELHYHSKIGESNAQLNIKASGNDKQLNYHIDLQVPDKAPFRLDGNHQETVNDKVYKYQESIVCDYFGSVIKSNVDLQFEGNDNIVLHCSLHTPYENARSVDITFKGTNSGDNSYTTNTQVVYNNQKYGLNTVITLENTKSEIQLTGITPEKTAIISVHTERIGDRKAKAGVKIENVLGFDFRGTAEGSFQNYEDFYIKAKLDSVNLKLNQLVIEASAEDGSNGKGVVILVKDTDNVIINGKATYNVKQDKGKAIIEGQGTIQYYQKQTNANFKLVRQKFDAGQDDESGFSYVFNGTFGPKHIVSEIKVTTKNFHVKLASCEEKKQCTNFEVKSVVTIDPKNPRSSQHKAMILIDLKELGYPHEFELQSKTTQNGFHVEHEIEVNIISNNNNKYQFLANLKPSNNRIALKLPKREIALETVHKMPKDGLLGRYENTIAFYFDKTNKPNEKTQLTISGDVNAVETTSFNAKGGVKFEHPAIRPLGLNGVVNMDKNKQLFTAQCAFDVFKSPKQKVVGTFKVQGTPIQQNQGYNASIEAHFKSEGLNFHYDFSGNAGINIDKREITLSNRGACQKMDLSYNFYLYTNGNDFELLLNAFDTELVHANGRINKKGKLHTETKLQLLEFKPITFTGEIDTANIGASFGIQQDKLLQVNGDFKLTKEAKLNVQGDGKKLANARIALDPGHFLSTTYDVNNDEVSAYFKTFEEHIKKDTEHARENVKKRYEKVREAFRLQLESLKNSAPDFTKLGNSYKQNLHEILTELEQDPLLHDSIGAYKQTYESFAKFLEEFVKTVSESYEKIYKIGADLYTKVAQAINDELIPLIQSYTDKVVAEVGQLYTDTVKILGTTLDEVLKTLKALEADLSKIGKPLYEFFSSVFESLTELYKSIEQELQEFTNEVVSGIKSLPKPEEIYESIKEKLVGIEIFDDLLVFLAEALNSMQEYVTTDEGKELFAKLHNYVDAKLKKQPINDAEKLEEIYTALINAARSYLSSDQSEGFFESIFTPVPYAFDFIGQIPIWTGFEFSLLNFLRNEQYDTFTESIVIRPPFNLLPPYELRGHVADGEHIFTFDGKHMTFPGSCQYILAQDSLHNNFSVVANLKDGKMKSIYLVDKENFVEVNDQGLLKLNGKNHEYPTHHKDLHAWRKYYTVSLLTEYGVLVHCTIDLRVCNIKVNGFYTGRTRGLLGNGNAEPYDDYVKPNGQIGSDYANFGNSYGIGNCPPVQFEDHSHHEKSPLCKELFDLDSTLFLGYPFMNPANYKEACNHAVSKAANKEDAACNIALAYASAGHDDLPVFVPRQCLKCNPNTQEQRNIGATFESKVPNNKADVVFVVDISLDKDHITNLVNPIIKDVRNQLKSRGIPDVHVAVIGYDYNLKYPQLYTTNGKLNFNGNLNDVIAADGPKYEELETVGVPEVDKILAEARKSKSQSITSSDSAAFKMAIAYPFRADASKVIVVVRHDNLEYTNVFKSFNAILTNQLVRSKGISLHLLSPVKDLSVQGVDTEKIIGFNTRLVATTEGKDAKKLSKLQYTGDMGVDLVNNDDGWIFALQNFQHQKTPEQKKIFVQTISSSIAEHTSKLETISECECKMVYGLHAEDTCSVESSKFVPGKKAKAN